MSVAKLKDGEIVLEPSAGIGLLADGIKRHNPTVEVDCVELNQACVMELKDKGYIVVGRDFFLFDTKHKYDCVIGAPNFRDNVDCDHVRKMYDHIKPGGRVVSIMSPAWMMGNSQRQIDFREWLSDKTYSMWMLPDNSYMEEGETVPTILIRIER